MKHKNEDAGRPPGTDPSKRDFLKTSAGLFASAAFAPLLPGSAAQEDAQAVERIERRNQEARGRVLVKGGTVITMDPDVGDFLQADVLIDGKKIVEVRPNIRASGTVIDATNMIVMPGLIDTGRLMRIAERSLVADKGVQDLSV